MTQRRRSLRLGAEDPLRLDHDPEFEEYHLPMDAKPSNPPANPRSSKRKYRLVDLIEQMADDGMPRLEDWENMPLVGLEALDDEPGEQE
ncbi:hypothetical protein G3580_18195 [Nitrogeniibacter mangrovi]|uniref:Uncharacterized protein n=1 Tax=Nitrogeniibacter mangrovi TaxID=2016596 RepID=A0A6C1B6L1_9RHOO|nr:hypothetical protein [Nitrogeniibacter mangrovi]QID19376.1 hypothetical protein G3580_18195 [Nitrogeniibacter mangrovi]